MASLRDRLRFIVLAATALLVAGCVTTSVAPSHLAPDSCAIDPRFSGTWRSERQSQLGRATMVFELDCGCAYRAKARVTLMSIREEGAYWVEDGRLLLTRGSGQVTEWPFAFEDGDLLLEEREGEVHRYEKEADHACP